MEIKCCFNFCCAKMNHQLDILTIQFYIHTQNINSLYVLLFSKKLSTYLIQLCQIFV